MHIIEVLTAMIVLLSATNFIVTVATPPTPSQDSLSNLSIIGSDALTTLDKMPVNDDSFIYYGEDLVSASAFYYNSLLVKCVSTHDINNVTSFFNTVLPKTISYTIYLSDGMITIPFYTGYGQPVGESATAHKLIVIRQVSSNTYVGYDFTPGVWDVNIVMWYGVRGGYIT